MMQIFLNVLILTIVIYLINTLLPAVHVKNFGTAILVAVTYSLLNFFFGWILLLLTFPIVFLTLGLFRFVINAFFLWLTDKLIDDFKIDGFGWTLLTAFLISVCSTVIHAVL